MHGNVTSSSCGLRLSRRTTHQVLTPPLLRSATVPAVGKALYLHPPFRDTVLDSTPISDSGSLTPHPPIMLTSLSLVPREAIRRCVLKVRAVSKPRIRCLSSFVVGPA